MRPSAQARAKLQRWIWNYQKRNEDDKARLKLKYGDWNKRGLDRVSPPEEWIRIFKSRKRKIDRWKRAMKIMDERSSKHNKLISIVEGFFGETLKVEGPISRKRPGPKLGVLFKYGLENGYTGYDLAKAIGIRPSVDRQIPSEARINFTKSFETIPENREIYTRFKRYVEEKAYLET